jgi:hypothetical protein
MIEMENDKIKQLLEQYWKCETSLEDEKMLRDFFANDTVPEDLKAYRSLFVWKNHQTNIQSAKKGKIVLKSAYIEYIYPTLKIAATVLILVTFGISIYTHYQQEKFMNRIFTDTAVPLEDSIRSSGEVVAKATSLQRMQESKLVDDDNLEYELINE